MSLEGIWDFKSTDLVDIDAGVVRGSGDKLRGRAEAGLSVRLSDGIMISGDGFYDGIGAKDYEAYGGNVTVSLPF